jgi:anti-anti-sigma factor
LLQLPGSAITIVADGGGHRIGRDSQEVWWKGMQMAGANDAFHVEVSGATVIISPVGDINSLSAELLAEASTMMTQMIEAHESPMLVIDLTGVPSCSSMFMSFLLRCHKSVKSRGGEMVLCSVSKMLQELLSLTRLDTVWAVYGTRSEAMEAVDS